VAAACGSAETLTLDPQRGAAVVGASYVVEVTVEGSSCGGHEVRVAFTGASPNRRATVAPDPILLNARHRATFSYRSAIVGTDRFEVWLDLDEDGIRDRSEPWESGAVVWTAAAPTRTATATRTPPSPTRTPSASRTPTPTRTSERQRGRS
jgi:hypothetical protein